MSIADDLRLDRFRDATSLSLWTAAVLWIFVLILAADAVLSGLLVSWLPDDATKATLRYLPPGPKLLILAHAFCAIGRALFLFVAGIVSLVWIHRANANLSALGAERLEFTPGWAVGWFFIPFASLWMPFRAVREIWCRSHDPRDRRNCPSGSVLVGVWWTCWIADNLLASFSFILAQGRATVLAPAHEAEMASACVSLVGCLLFLAIIRGVQAHQTAQHRLQAGARPMAEAPRL